MARHSPWELRTPDSEAARGGKFYTSQSLLTSSWPLAVGAVWRGPRPALSWLRHTERLLRCPQARHPPAGGKGEGWGWWWEQCSPGDVYKQLHWLPAGAPVQTSAPCPLPEHLCHFSLSQCHQDGKADAGGDQVQEGRLQEDIGCEAMLGRIPSQGHEPFPWHDRDSYCPGSQSQSVSGPESGLLTPGLGLLLPRREGKKPKETQVHRARRVPGAWLTVFQSPRTLGSNM